MSLVLKDKKKSIGFTYAWNGLREIFVHERNFRIHIGAAIIVVVLGIILQLTSIEWAILFVVIALVLILEILNSIIERMVDYIHPEYHRTAKFIKDAAAGAVLVAAISSVIIGCLLFIPKILEYF